MKKARFKVWAHFAQGHTATQLAKLSPTQEFDLKVNAFRKSENINRTLYTVTF